MANRTSIESKYETYKREYAKDAAIVIQRGGTPASAQLSLAEFDAAYAAAKADKEEEAAKGLRSAKSLNIIQDLARKQTTASKSIIQSKAIRTALGNIAGAGKAGAGKAKSKAPSLRDIRAGIFDEERYKAAIKSKAEQYTEELRQRDIAELMSKNPNMQLTEAEGIVKTRKYGYEVAEYIGEVIFGS